MVTLLVAAGQVARRKVERLACETSAHPPRRPVSFSATWRRRRPTNVNSARSNGTTKQKTLAKLGIFKDQWSQWQKLAVVPNEQFEAELAGPEMVEYRYVCTALGSQLSSDSLDTCGLLSSSSRQRLAVPFPYSPPQCLLLRRLSPPKRRANTVVEKGTPELVAKMDAGEG